jgi:hypothetical protein
MLVSLPQEITVVARRVGGEPALELRHGDALVLFGLGPPAAAAAPPERRAAAILAELSPALRCVRWARQIHGATVLDVASPGSGSVACVGDADGLASCDPGTGLVVWTADCVPVALVAPGAVAMVHAGWRGAAAGIVAAAVCRIAEWGIPPGQLRVFLGPAVCGRHYQVGPEVIEALELAGVPAAGWHDGDRVDLRAFLAGQLADLGVAGVQAVGPCTFDTPKLASYRRDGAAAGRQWSLVWRSDARPHRG